MKQAFKYRIVVEWSDADDAYVARVPALPGCAAHGPSPERAASEARKAAETMLEVLQEDGDPLPPADLTGDYSGQIRIRMPRSLHARLSRLAEVEDTSLNHLMVSVLAEACGEKTRGARK
ncbi:MAG: type II toxin-antitoxin system HicB family antitoxin [Acidobacteriota bacterium]